MMRSAAVLLTFILAQMHMPALADGDPVNGKKLAQEYCQRCHDITPEGAFKQYPPSFRSIAVYRSRDQIYARIVLPNMHPIDSEMRRGSGLVTTLPFFLLKGDEIDDVIAFITSLENQ